MIEVTFYMTPECHDDGHVLQFPDRTAWLAFVADNGLEGRMFGVVITEQP
jgi:hypothetical protein